MSMADAGLATGLTLVALLVGYLAGWKSGRESGFKCGYTLWSCAVRRMAGGTRSCPCCGASVSPPGEDHSDRARV